MPDGGLGADTSEDGGDIGDRPDLGLLVALTLCGHYRVPLWQLFRENYRESLGNAYLAEFLPQNERQRAVVGFGKVGKTD